ncbi:MAG: hypothetical protein IPO37_01245 [Saprospiraceae bacterium]|nr:hypothetical protein [Saprospiraceae bacterium]MBP6446931.1 hypothetical protein [Saprospiraceae bacterium]
MLTTIDKDDKYHLASINVSELAQGMYFLIIDLDDKTQDVQKFVKLQYKFACITKVPEVILFLEINIGIKVAFPLCS